MLKRVFCRKCVYYNRGNYNYNTGDSCTHPKNSKLIYNYLKQETKRRYTPKKRNKHNHCSWFKSLEGEKNEKVQDLLPD